MEVNDKWTAEATEKELANITKGMTKIEKFGFIAGALIGAVIATSDDQVCLFLARELAMLLELNLGELWDEATSGKS